MSNSFLELKNNFYIVLITLIISTCFNSCKKKEKKSLTEEEKSLTELEKKIKLLTNKSNGWVLDTGYIQPSSAGITNYKDIKPICETDDILIFGNQLIVDENKFKCESQSPKKYNINWQLNQTDSTLLIIFKKRNDEMFNKKVTTLTGDTLKYKTKTKIFGNLHEVFLTYIPKK